MLTAVMLMPLAMLLAPLASSRPRTSPPVMHLDVVDALTPIVAMVQPREFEFDSLPLSPLDVLRDFLGPIVVSINNDPLWQFALVVGMVGSWVTIAQTRATVVQPKATITKGATNLVTAAPTLPAPKMPSAVPWRPRGYHLET